MKREWWVRGVGFTCWVETTDGVITDAAPYLRKFIGQPDHHLKFWRRFIEWREIRPNERNPFL